MTDLGPILIHSPAWLMVLFRLSGVFLLSPMLGSATVPRTVKGMFVFVLSLAIYPTLITDTTQPAFAHLIGWVGASPSIWALAPIIGLELLIGYFIGLCATLPLVGMQLGGHIVDQQLGLSFAQIVNPELGDSSGVVGEFLFIVSLGLFALLGGHLAIVATLIGSFHAVEPGGMTDIGGLLGIFIGLLTVTFEVAMRVAAPVLCLMLMVTVGMGFVARTVPQMNILSVGFSIRILVGGLMLTLITASIGERFVELFDTVWQGLEQAFLPRELGR
ncbi:MAG: flagellar biosynthetic protein FliR [Planctomycetota bacterium]